MTASSAGERRRHMDEQIKQAVREAVSEALRGANLVDGPTHIAHHQAIEEFLVLTKHAKKTVIGGVVLGVLSLFLLGIAACYLVITIPLGQVAVRIERKVS